MVKIEGKKIVKETSKGKIPKIKNKMKLWTTIGIVVLFLVIAGGATGGSLIHISNTSPQFCATCHIMEYNVNSYLTSNNMDNAHNQAGVQCKECHDYPVIAEISSGIKFLVGDYTVDKNGKLLQVTYSDTMCLQCHISYEYVAISTDFLTRNPHNNHNGKLACKTCHISHGEQIHYCSQCHDDSGHRMIGEEIEPRGTIPYIPEISQ